MLASLDSTALPHDRRLNARIQQWVREAGLTERWSAQQLGGLHIDFVVDAAFPRVPMRGRVLAAAWILLFCAIDDLADGDGLSPQQLRAQLDELRRALSGQSPERPQNLLERACARFFRSIRSEDPRRLETFHRRIGTLFDTYVEEAAMHRDGIEPGLARYLQLRRTTSGMPAIFSLFPLLTGLPFPEMRPELRELEMWASDLVGWENDLRTVDKERGTSSGNLVFVLEGSHGMSSPDALRVATSMFEQRQREFSARANTLLEPHHDASTRLYASMLVSCVQAHHDWAQVTGRYDPPTSERWEPAA